MAKIKSNLDSYYEELIGGMARNANEDIKDGVEREEAVWQAIDNGLIFYADQAYIIAQAILSGCIAWGEHVDWEQINDMIYEDVVKEMEEE